MAVAASQDKSIVHILQDVIVENRHALIADNTAVATADGSDAATTQALANALKVKLNLVITTQNLILDVLAASRFMAAS